MSEVQGDVSRNSKAVLISVLALIMIVAYLVISYLTDKPTPPSNISRLQNTTTHDAKETQHYNKVLNGYNNKNASEAENTGDSYISVLSAREKDTPDTNDQDKKNDQPKIVYKYIQVPQQQQQAPQQIEGQAQAIDELTKVFLDKWKPAPHGAATVSNNNNYATSLTPAEYSNMTAQNNQQQLLQSEKIVEDFALVPGTLQTDIDTDENSGLVVEVRSGKYKGMKVFADGYKLLTKTVDVNLKWMQWRGRSYKIQAKLVDQHSGRTSLSGDVNNRWFSRIILPAIAEGIGKAGEIYAQSGTSTSVSDGVIVQSRDGNPSGKQISGAVIGGIGSQTANVLKQDAARMPIRQVLIPQGETVGIQFYGPVLAKDDLAQQSQQQPSFPSAQSQYQYNGTIPPANTQPYNSQQQYQQYQQYPTHGVQPQRAQPVPGIHYQPQQPSYNQIYQQPGLR